MNTKNNQRKKTSKHKLESAFIELLQDHEVKDISITEICKQAKLNRSTFYANYLDIFDLMDAIKDRMMEEFHELYADEEINNYNSNDFLKLFYHIRDNQLFYQTYFKLGFETHFQVTQFDTHYAQRFYDNRHVKYHIEFFRAGITQMIKIWLGDNCDLPPVELMEIIKAEYRGKPTL